MRFLLLSRDGDHLLGAELARMGHDTVITSGEEVTAATISLVDVLVLEAGHVSEPSGWFSRLRAQIRAAEVTLFGLARRPEELPTLMEVGV
ncbi:MAG TPA: hypothetical protein VLQ93_15410, partial [Myxococcaceae bacterium]|nr:hypothetical protein [Myxococcaceae bacterium]